MIRAAITPRQRHRQAQRLAACLPVGRSGRIGGWPLRGHVPYRQHGRTGEGQRRHEPPVDRPGEREPERIEHPGDKVPRLPGRHQAALGGAGR